MIDKALSSVKDARLTMSPPADGGPHDSHLSVMSPEGIQHYERFGKCAV